MWADASYHPRIDTPHVVTDGQCLLTTAAAGTVRATASSRPLVAVWRTIVAALDADVSLLVTRDKLRRLPAHKSLELALQARNSNGDLVTEIGWRANRLADAIARRCTHTLAAPRAAAKRPQLAA